MVAGITNLDLYTYLICSNRISNITFSADGTRGLTYDNAGNVIFDNRNGIGYTYDAANRMSAFAINGVVQAEYEYNYLGQQVIRRLTQTGEKVHSIHDHEATGSRNTSTTKPQAPRL